jgi:hypothetical protein
MISGEKKQQTPAILRKQDEFGREEKNPGKTPYVDFETDQTTISRAVSYLTHSVDFVLNSTSTRIIIIDYFKQNTNNDNEQQKQNHQKPNKKQQKRITNKQSTITPS